MSRTSQSLRDVVKQLEVYDGPGSIAEECSRQLQAHTEAVDGMERDLADYRAAASAVIDTAGAHSNAIDRLRKIYSAGAVRPVDGS